MTVGRGVPWSASRWAKRVPVAALLVVVLVSIWASPAAAHASLVSSDPQPNAVLELAPDRIRLVYSEAVDADLSTVTVEIDGSRVDDVAIEIDPDDGLALIVRLPVIEVDGVAVVRWSVLSQADGHLTEGILVFGIGDESDPGSVTFAQPGARVEPLDLASRWLQLGLLMIMLGAVWVGLVVLRSPDRGEIEALRRRCLILARRAAVAYAVALVVAAAVQVWILAGGVDGRSVGGVVASLLFDSRWGTLWWVRLLGAGAAAAVIAVVGGGVGARPGSDSSRIPTPVVVAPLLLVVGAQAMSSHAAGVGDSFGLAVAADALHLLAAAVWVGGLFAVLWLVVVRRPGVGRPSEGGDLQARILDRFGPSVIPAGMVLAATGLVAVARQALSLDAVLRSGWGRVLLIKIALVAIMAVIGLVQRRRELASVGRRLAAEGAVAVLVVTAAAALTALPTANGPDFTPAAELGPDTRSGMSADISSSLSIKPNQPGQNLITVQAASRRRPAPAPIGLVLLRARSLDDDRAPETVELSQVGEGTWELLDPVLSSPGDWQLEVVIRRAGVEDEVVAFDWPLSSIEARPRLVSDRRWLRPLTAVATLPLVFAMAMVVVSRRRAGAREQEERTSVAVAVGSQADER